MAEYASLSYAPHAYEDQWRREQRIERALREAYMENVGHAPPEPPAGLEREYRMQYAYGIPLANGGYRQPRKAERPLWVERLTRVQPRMEEAA